MKKLKNLTMLLVSVMATMLAFSSCISDGDDYSINEATQRSYMQTMSSSYMGKVRMFYITPNGMTNKQIVKYDSLQTTWSVRRDSTLTLYDFPINKLDSAINIPANANNAEIGELKALRDAISNAKAPENIKGYYYIPTTTFVNSQYMQFVVNPIYVMKKLTYNGKTHDVYFVFRTGYYGGTYTISSRLFEYNMYLQSISIDKVPQDYTNSVPTSYFRNILITCESK